MVMSNILSKLSTSTLQGRCRVVKIDTEKYPDIATRFGVQALPTLMLFKDGAVVDRIEGAPPEDMLLNRLEPHLPSAKSAA